MSDGNAVQLPYPMQLGSGTWDVLPGITVLGMSEGWSWGFQGMGRLRMGENSRGYRQGHAALGTAWFALKPPDMLSLSVRAEWRLWGDYSGHDSAYMNPMMAPTVREDLRGGRRLDVPLGLNFYFPDGALAGHRLAVEWHMPPSASRCTVRSWKRTGCSRWDGRSRSTLTDAVLFATMTSIQTRSSWQRLRIRGGCAVTATVMLMCAAAVAGRPPGASAQTGGVRLYEAPMASSAPVIDGDLSEEAWRDAPWTESFVDIRGEDWPSPVWTTRAKITWDAHCLYIGAKLEEPHLWATLAERDAIIYRDHDFEVFIDPDGDGLAYYELEINALGTEFDLFLDRPYSRGGRAYIEWDMAGLQTAVRLDGTLNDPSDEDAGWTVEIAIPWSALRPPVEAVAEGAAALDTAGTAGEMGRQAREARANAVGGAAPSPGDEWRVNFSRVQWPLDTVNGGYRKAREPVDWSDHPEDNWVWSPQGEIDMHLPEMWGVVRFVTETPK